MVRVHRGDILALEKQHLASCDYEITQIFYYEHRIGRWTEHRNKPSASMQSAAYSMHGGKFFHEIRLFIQHQIQINDNLWQISPRKFPERFYLPLAHEHVCRPTLFSNP